MAPSVAMRLRRAARRPVARGRGERVGSRHVPVAQITSAEAAAALAAGAVLVDVREDDEWAAGHVDGAVHLPLGELAERLDELDRARDVVFACRVGARSDVAAAIAERAGFRAANLAGGLRSWEAEGLPLVPPDGEVL